ncbi:aldo/keto reductase [Bacillus pseudomycoides]|uniref:aldo/keto reductase n=1 Tax=Bacillus pseudomycoides TaxID=64104 RepID=UPI000BEB743C|nr:aldo/keto reductase [Bacillus pseudomycoides]PEB39217.1 oxidoreductase [Bacillus pseudomycoides]PGD96342.1 oxidoreductase [Bacillus pseudomycoides]PGE05430.1 oxidoreductase [Bacillus pseudomycoides]PHE71891.1 oxidoreductase [Bacillus pseudomycoides]PHG18499.1 oxidoreductase [Bacillus pseudomycoides]
MERIQMANNLEFSRIIQGFWRLAEWNMPKQELLSFIKNCMEMGITTFDHADIYGGYTCESLFGEALQLQPSLRDNMQIVTKCGIAPLSPKFPKRYVAHYNTSTKHIVKSVEQSLQNLHTDYIDLLLIHRPDPFMDPSEVAEAFTRVKQEGKVRHFGVSNFLPSQFNMLSSYLDFPLITNQIEVSAMQLEHFEKGTIDLCQEKRISPMIWSPLAGGEIFTGQNERAVRLRKTLQKVANELNADGIDIVMYAWLLAHPANMMPIVGSGKLDRVKSAIAATKLTLDRQQWFTIFESSNGHPVP